MKKLFKFAVVGLVVLASCMTVHADMVDDMLASVHGRQATLSGDIQVVYLGYNVASYGYLTGVNIMPDQRNEPIRVYVGFFQGEHAYSMRAITVPQAGWTGLITDLLEAGVQFKSPSLVAFVSDGALNGRFWVNQFIFTSNGFSHIQQTSEKH